MPSRWGCLLVVLAFAGSVTPGVQGQDATSDAALNAPVGTFAPGPAPQYYLTPSPPSQPSSIFSLPSYIQTTGTSADNVVIQWNKVSFDSLLDEGFANFDTPKNFPQLYISRCCTALLACCLFRLRFVSQSMTLGRTWRLDIAI